MGQLHLQLLRLTMPALASMIHFQGRDDLIIYTPTCAGLITLLHRTRSCATCSGLASFGITVGSK
jgi:hypothetical protein